MPRKGLDYNLDNVKSGQTDFRMDDLRISRHAKKRVNERGSGLEDLRRRPVLAHNNHRVVSTYLPTIQKPKYVSGEFWSTTRKGEIAPKSPLLFREEPFQITIPHHKRASLFGKGGVVIKNLQQTFKVKINVTSDDRVHISGSGDVNGAAAEILKIAGPQFTIVDVSGCEDIVIGREGRVISMIRNQYRVDINFTNNGKALISSASKVEVDGAVDLVSKIVNNHRLAVQKAAARTVREKQTFAATTISRWWRAIRGLPSYLAKPTKKKRKGKSKKSTANNKIKTSTKIAEVTEISEATEVFEAAAISEAQGNVNGGSGGGGYKTHHSRSQHILKSSSNLDEILSPFEKEWCQNVYEYLINDLKCSKVGVLIGELHNIVERGAMTSKVKNTLLKDGRFAIPKKQKVGYERVYLKSFTSSR